MTMSKGEASKEVSRKANKKACGVDSREAREEVNRENSEVASR